MMVQNEQGSWYENNHPPIGDCSLMLAAAKDAEIERLHKENLALVSEQDSLNYEIIKLNKLITELCDALEKANPTDRYKALLQRAREATR